LKENIQLSINIEPLSKINPLISRFKCNIAAVNVKANSYIFSKEILSKLIPTLKGAPILTYYSEIDDKFAGHESDLYISNTRAIKRTPELSAIGFVDYVSEPTFENINENEWLVCTCYLWDGRFSFLQNLSERTNIYQSMELAADYDLMSDGTKKVTDAVLVGLALIGISPAFDGSTFTAFSKDNVQSELDQLKAEYELFAHRYSVLDFTIPQEVKQSAQDGLNLNKELGRGGTAVSLAVSRFLIKNETATPEKIRHISKYFNRHFNDDFNDKTSNSWIAWQLNGGDTGYKWSKKINDEMDELDKKKLAYMKEDENVIIEAVEKFSLNSSQITEILQNAFSEYKYGENNWLKYWVNAFDADYVYVCDSEDNKSYRFTYNIVENVATIDMESKEEVIRGEYIPVSQNADLSANQNVDAVAMQALNEKAAEDNKKLAEENEGLKTQLFDIQEKMSTMETDMAKAKEDSEVYMKENEELKTFKADIEKQNKSFAVETTLQDVADVLPEEEMNACRLSAEKFTLVDIDIWKNEVQAKAFKFSKNIPEQKGFIKIPLPNNDGSGKKSDHLWS